MRAHIIMPEDPAEYLHRNQKSIVSRREIAVDRGLLLRPDRPGARRQSGAASAQAGVSGRNFPSLPDGNFLKNQKKPLTFHRVEGVCWA